MAAEQELAMGEYKLPAGRVLVASKAAFAAWMKTAKVGDTCVYARAVALPIGKPGCIEAVRQQCEEGQLDLVQRRVPLSSAGPGGFAYLAIRRQGAARRGRAFVARRGRVSG